MRIDFLTRGLMSQSSDRLWHQATLRVYMRQSHPHLLLIRYHRTTQHQAEFTYLRLKRAAAYGKKRYVGTFPTGGAEGKYA